MLPLREDSVPQDIEFPEHPPCTARWMFLKTSSSQNIHLAVQGVRLVMVGFERVQACKCVFDFGILNLPQAREQRLFLVRGVLGGRFPKVSESGLERGPRLFGQGTMND